MCYLDFFSPRLKLTNIWREYSLLKLMLLIPFHNDRMRMLLMVHVCYHTNKVYAWAARGSLDAQ